MSSSELLELVGEPTPPPKKKTYSQNNTFKKSAAEPHVRSSCFSQTDTCQHFVLHAGRNNVFLSFSFPSSARSLASCWLQMCIRMTLHILMMARSQNRTNWFYIYLFNYLFNYFSPFVFNLSLSQWRVNTYGEAVFKRLLELDQTPDVFCSGPGCLMLMKCSRAGKVTDTRGSVWLLVVDSRLWVAYSGIASRLDFI